MPVQRLPNVAHALGPRLLIPNLWLNHPSKMREVAVRTMAILVGLVLFGVGIALLFLAELGVAPWDILHDALAKLLDRRPGTVLIVLSVPIAGLVVLLRQPIGPATIANTVIIGLVLDLVLAIVEPPSTMAMRVALVVAAPIVVAFGSMLYLGGGLGAGVRDALMTALVGAGLSTRAARTLIEASVVVIGGALGGAYGVGTLVFALAVGPSLQYFQRHVWAGFPEPPRWVYRRN